MYEREAFRLKMPDHLSATMNVTARSGLEMRLDNRQATPMNGVFPIEQLSLAIVAEVAFQGSSQ